MKLSMLALHFKFFGRMFLKIIDDCEYMSHIPYASAIDSPMYAMVYTRLDLSQVVRMILRYMHDPGKSHWEVMRWILRYIKDTVDVGLVFEKDVGGK